MQLEDKIEELAKYSIGFEIRDGYYHVSIVFNDEWDIITPENEYIHAEKRDGVTHYIGDVHTIKIEDIFNSIDSTIEYNIDLEKKLALFKDKVEELNRLFSEKSLKELETMEFVFPRKKKNIKKAKQTVTTKEVEEKEESEEIIQNNILEEHEVEIQEVKPVNVTLENLPNEDNVIEN